MKRLAARPTNKIDRSTPLSFTWAGRKMTGMAGDSVATALFANEVKIVSRSLKYHRPRGLYSLDGESSNTLVNINGEPNCRAETVLLQEGMKVEPQNTAFDAEFDPMGFMDYMDGQMEAGFYYKKFHKPAALWPFFQNRIREAAGVGRADTHPHYHEHDFQELYPNAEVVVIGGGPAGMSAALSAAEAGCRVVLFEGRPNLGGFYDWRTREYDGEELTKRGSGLVSKVNSNKSIRVLANAFVMNVNGDNLVTGFQIGTGSDPFIQRYIEIRPESVIVATGCIERALVCENNERPGVMQAGCALRLVRQYGLKPGEKAVYSIADDLGIESALGLAEAGIDVLAVADARTEGADPELTAALEEAGIAYYDGWAASAIKGSKLVKGVTLATLDGTLDTDFDCDLVVASAGQTPLTGPLSTVNAKLAFDLHTGFFLPQEMPPRVHAAGRLLGLTDPKAIEASGRLAGLKAAAENGAETDIEKAEGELEGLPGPARGCLLAHGPNIGLGRKAFICFDEDGTYKTAKQSADQSFDVPELAKRFGGFGLGPSQGGIPNHNLPLILAEIRGDGPESLKPTTVRAPIVPPLIQTVAGPGHDIFKRTPMEAEQLAQGGLLRRVGVWKRARYFSEDLTCAEEISAVRNGVGMIDVSTLGKFKLFGPDAQKALQRCYISDMSKIPEGKLKYSAMLNDDGCIVDDGVITQVGPNEYYLTASTGRAGGTIEWFRYHTRYEGWDFHMVNLTDGLAAINLAGPKSRDVLAKVTEADLATEAFPYMGYREIEVGDGVPVKAMRLGFVGELSYELHFPASYGAYVWNLLAEAGAEFDIRPFGLEAQFVCRLEKGHVIIGQETEQRVNLRDLGMSFLWAKNDTESGKIGAPALRFTAEAENRFKLIGFTMNDGEPTPGDGSVIFRGDDIKGFVCSARYSRTLEKSIGMAIVREELSAPGQKIRIYQNDRNNPLNMGAVVTPAPFYDPEGLKLKS